MMQGDTIVALCILTTMTVAAAFFIFHDNMEKKKVGAWLPKKRKLHGGNVSGMGIESSSGPEETYKQLAQMPVTRRKTRSVAIASEALGTPPVTRSKTNPISIRTNSGGGDCLFHCFKEAIKGFGVDVTIRELRTIVAENTTEDQFMVLKVIFDGAVEENEYDVVKDYDFMRGVSNLEELRKVILTTKYWGDEMAIRAIEEASGLNAVVLTKDSAGNPVVAKKLDGNKHPPTKRYAILLLENSHYQLISYKGRTAISKDDVKASLELIFGEFSNG